MSLPLVLVLSFLAGLAGRHSRRRRRRSGRRGRRGRHPNWIEMKLFEFFAFRRPLREHDDDGRQDKGSPCVFAARLS